MTDVVIALSIALVVSWVVGGYCAFKYYCIRRLLFAKWRPKLVKKKYYDDGDWIGFIAPDETKPREWFEAFRRLIYLNKIKELNLPDKEQDEQKAIPAAGSWQ